MGFSAYENFKGFASSRPLLMVFMICLGFFAVILMSLAYYVKTQDMPNPDVSQDWNVFLENFAELEFCILNMSSPVIENQLMPSSTTMSMRQGPTKKLEDTTIVQQFDDTPKR